MANRRIFQAQGLVTNGVAIGGMSTIGFNAAFRDVIQSTPDGAVGVEDVDRAGLRVGVSLQCTDVTKVNAILDAPVGNTTFSGKESGATTWHHYTVSQIVWTGMNLGLNKNGDATLRLDGVVRFPNSTDGLAQIIALTGGGPTPPTLAYPARLYRPFQASFTPDGASAITPLHTESINLSLAANVLEDYADADVGHTAVDIAGWNALQVTHVYRDALAVSPSDVSAQILGGARGVLAVSLKGRGGAADQVLTINNVLWTGSDSNHQAGYTDFSMPGVAGWKNGATVYGLNSGTRLFSFA